MPPIESYFVDNQLAYNIKQTIDRLYAQEKSYVYARSNPLKGKSISQHNIIFDLQKSHRVDKTPVVPFHKPKQQDVILNGTKMVML